MGGQLFENKPLEHCIRCGGRGWCKKYSEAEDEELNQKCPYCWGTGVTDENPIGRAAGATFSLDGKYRYRLWRMWDWESPTIAFIGLNPSTADANKLDNTTTKCVHWAKRDGFGQYVMLNLFGLVSTDPKGLKTVDDPTGTENDDWIRTTLSEAKAVVFCWGCTAQKLTEPRIKRVEEMTRDAGLKPLCVAVTKGGFPKHPLYAKNNTILMPYLKRN